MPFSFAMIVVVESIVVESGIVEQLRLHQPSSIRRSLFVQLVRRVDGLKYATNMAPISWSSSAVIAAASLCGIAMAPRIIASHATTNTKLVSVSRRRGSCHNVRVARKVWRFRQAHHAR
eukprot:SAG11_NODE_11697_length_743_cov_1.447205_2_plen_119_part_00